MDIESESNLPPQVDQPNPNESVDHDAFNNWLINKVSRQSTMVSRAHGEKVIEYLKEERELGTNDPTLKSKFSSQFRFQVKKRKFRLINVVGLGDILCLPIKDKNQLDHSMLGQHRQLIFKEDMFSVINIAHVNGERHRGYKGTFNKINATYCNIPREIVSKFVSMCKFCQKAHACFAAKNVGERKNKKKSEQNVEKRKEIQMEFLTRCQVDILDMQTFPDIEGQFYYIAHFLDHHSKYNVLIPLKRTDAYYVAKKLCRYVFGHFGLPRIIHSNLGRKYVDDIITWILQLWSTDAQILNGNPRFKKMAPLIQQRQKTVVTLIETIRAKQPDLSNWSSWLPGIQYSLNTNQFEGDNAPSYYIVYTRRPKVYTYSPNSKDIPREEDVIEESTSENNEAQINEVITVSMNELLHTPNTIIIPQLSPSNETGDSALDPNKTMQSEEMKNSTTTSTITADLSNLGSIPLSFGEQQYTLINFGGQTLQIPVVNIANTSISLQVPSDTSMTHQDDNGGDVAGGGMQLQNSATLTLSDNNTLSLLPDESTLGLENQETTDTLHRLTNTDDETQLGLHHNDDGNSTLTLANETLTLTSHTGGTDDDESLIGNLEVLDTGHSNENNLHGESEDCFSSMKEDDQSSPRFEISSLENEIDEAVNAEGTY